MADGVYHSDNPMQLKAGYGYQIGHFLTETGIDVTWLDANALFATSGYLAPGICGGNLTLDEANTKSVYHPGKRYQLLDLVGNGVVVPDKPDKRSRSSVKGLIQAKDEKFAIKDVDAGDVNILEADNTIYQYGKLVKIADVVAKIKQENKKDVIYGGFGCPSCNKEHTMNPKTTPYSFAFISDQGGGVMFKCTGNACAEKPLYLMDEQSSKGDPKQYRIYRANDQGGNLKMAIFDRKANTFIKPQSGSKSPLFSLSGGLAKGINLKILDEKTNEVGLKKYLALCDEVEIVRHGYKNRAFVDLGQGKQIFYDAPIPKFQVKEIEPTEIVKKAVSIFVNDYKTAGQSTALVILGSYLFGKRQAMAVLAFVGDPGTAKTFYGQELIKEYYGHEWVGSITPDEHAWGDVEYGKRHICYNDVDKMTEHNHKRLVGKIKRRATEGEDGTLNMKAGAIVKSTATSQSVTSNYAEALPVDAEGKDRRIYIPKVNFDKADKEEMAKAFDPKIGGKVATQNRRDLICYIYKVWKTAAKTDAEAVKTLLFNHVPMTDEKQDVMSQGMADGKALLNDIAHQDEFSLYDSLEPYIDKEFIENTFQEPKADPIKDLVDMIVKRKVDAGKDWFLPQDLLVEIRWRMTSYKGEGKPSQRQTAESFIGKKKFAPLSVNGISGQRGIKILK